MTMDHTNSGKHIFTVDVENWYDCFTSSRRFGGNCDSNLYRNLQRILLILRRLFFGKRIPISGGAWFRMLPYGVTKRAFERITEKNDSIGVFYIHPWELDTDHPCLMGDPRVMVPHYWNLRNTEKKLIDLLDRFSFSSMSQIFSDFTFAVKEEEN